MNPILLRIEQQGGVPGLVDALSRLPPTDLQSVLLEVHQRQAARVTPAHLLEQYTHNRFVQPASGNVGRLLDFERMALHRLPAGYEALELSPLAPLGSNSALASVHQNKVVTTNRTVEVVADSTNVMALESALRRRKSTARIKLMSNHRLVRAQSFSVPDAKAHFRVLALTAAGRDEGAWRFEQETLEEQLLYYVALLDGRPCRMALTDLGDGRLGRIMLERMSGRMEVVLDPDRQSGRGYYQSLCFKIHGRRRDESLVEIGDGGFTDWTAQLLSNRKERFLIGCLAPERVLSEL